MEFSQGKTSNYTGQAKKDEKMDLYLGSIDKDLQNLWRKINEISPYAGFYDRGDPAAHDFTSFTKDNAWHDLDLSPIVPAGAKAVDLFVSVQNNVTATGSVKLRKNGNSNEYAIKMVEARIASKGYQGSITIPCDSDRVIEYKIDTADLAANITVVGWWRDI